MTSNPKNTTTSRRITRSDIVRALLYGRLGFVAAFTVLAIAFVYLALSEPV